MNQINILKDLEKRKIIKKQRDKHFLHLKGFKPFEIDKIFTKNIEDDNILVLKSKQKEFEYWIDQNILIPPWQTHWFQLKDGFLLKLKANELINIIERARRKAGNTYKLCKTIKLSSPSFYIFLNGRINLISVKKLKRILKFLNTSYEKFNKKIEFTKKSSIISINKPRFPIELNNTIGASLLGAIVSDGSLYVDKKARNVIRTKYSSNDDESLNKFINNINKIYGKVHFQKEKIRNCTTLKIGSSIIGETLLKVGAILGNKAKKDEKVPWIVRKRSEEIKKEYLKSAFDDEASIYVSRKKSYIIMSRYKQIKLTKKQERKLSILEKQMSKRELPTGHINKSITIKRATELINDKELEKEIRSIPNLLSGESTILNEMEIKHRIWNRCLNKNHSGSYSVCCDLFINRKDSIMKFYNKIGFSLTKKQEKLINIVKFIRQNDTKGFQYLNAKEGNL